MLGDLFKKLRQSEPTRVLVLRRIVILVSLFLLVVIFSILCIGVRDELPSIKTTFSLVDSIPAPDIVFFFKTNFTISCVLFSNIDGAPIQNETECANRNIKQTASLGDSYKAQFLPENTSFDNKTNIKIRLSPLITTPIPDSFTMRGFDSEFSGLRRDIERFIHTDPFIQEIIHKNEYPLSQINGSSSSYTWKFTRHKRRIIINDALSYIGFGPNYDDRAYLDSNIQFVPSAAGTSGNTEVIITISPQSFTITEETEQRSKTIAGVLGTVGGVWGIIMSLYMFLFGAELVSPWGIVQNFLKTKPNLEDSEPGEDEKNDLEKRTRHLEERNKFYEEYIISIPSNEKEKTTKPWYKFRGLWKS